MQPPEPATQNLFNPEIAKAVKYNSLPVSLEEAKALAEKSDFVKGILG